MIVQVPLSVQELDAGCAFKQPQIGDQGRWLRQYIDLAKVDARDQRELGLSTFSLWSPPQGYSIALVRWTGYQ